MGGLGRVRAALLLGSLLAVAGDGFPWAAAGEHSGPVTVEVAMQDGRWRLLRGGRPYTVHGAGVDGGSLAALAAHGGNAVRTWSTRVRAPSGRHVLDEAQHHGITVALCLDIGRERHGFDYVDSEAVAAQLKRMRAEVEKYKDHPALLAWIIGNEPNLHFENPRVFDAINDISLMVHEVDGHHPTTTALAGFNGELAALLETRAPDLDFLSIQMYGDIVNLPRYIEESGYAGPYMITEWGAVGHWEVATTAWGAPVEQHSSAKARSYRRAWDAAVANAPQVIGSFVFLWGQKQERTPTWYGMFLADGSRTEAVDVTQRLWTGRWPDNRAPRIDALHLDGRVAGEDIVLSSGARYEAEVSAVDPDEDRLTYRWEIMRESTATQTGGDREEVPETMDGLIEGAARPEAVISAPPERGAYRLFVYVYDGEGQAGHANVPFLVE